MHVPTPDDGEGPFEPPLADLESGADHVRKDLHVQADIIPQYFPELITHIKYNGQLYSAPQYMNSQDTEIVRTGSL